MDRARETGPSTVETAGFRVDDFDRTSRRMNEELSPSDPQAFDDEPVFGSPRPPPPSLDSSSCDGALYSLLNVEQDASEADIAKAYKSLAVLLHPDKHGDPRKREAAQAHFEAVHRAYEGLSFALSAPSIPSYTARSPLRLA